MERSDALFDELVTALLDDDREEIRSFAEALRDHLLAGAEPPSRGAMAGACEFILLEKPK
ncbi:MAG: hypothetical protein GY722_07085 [bacterium]|nr:hypothetical protein [bacterium]